MSKPTIYTTGYSGHRPAELRALVERLDATVIDIRHTPRSRVQGWNKVQLINLLGLRYAHFAEFGNRNHKERWKPIEIVDFDSGLERLYDFDGALIFLCQCPDGRKCHRRVLREKLSAEGFEISELEGW